MRDACYVCIFKDKSNVEKEVDEYVQHFQTENSAGHRKQCL